MIFQIVIILVVVTLVAIAILYLLKQEQPTLYCIMITGKDPCREHFAKQSITNFLEQDYQGNKRMIIINHGSYRLQDSHSNSIYEFHVDKAKNNLTLGDLRNIARAMVPPDAIWTTWDDDDYHAPNFISTMMKKLGRADVLAWTRRTEFNANTGLVWEMERKTGFSPLIFARQDMRMLYTRKDSMEDVHLLDIAKQLGKRIIIYQNDPALYIRTVHGNNTSLYVDRNKIDVSNTRGNYIERNVDAKTAQKIRGFMMEYFKHGIEC
jgi:hypothetical protein